MVEQLGLGQLVDLGYNSCRRKLTVYNKAV